MGNSLKKQTLRLASDPARLEEVLAFVEQAAAGMNITDDLYDRVLLIASEAVTNAMEHGNQYDPNKEVTLTMVRTETAIVLQVKDEGPGFDPEALKDPLAAENLLNTSGRGVFLIETLADEVAYLDQGREIQMHFWLEPPNAD